VLTDDGPLALDVPRDRERSFEPRLIGKHERRFTGFDDKIIALDARGLTVREIQAFSLRGTPSRSRRISSARSRMRW
jgi:putative transposase